MTDPHDVPPPGGDGDGGAGGPSSLLDGLPEPTREDVLALRAARRHRLSPAQVRELWKSLPGPSAEELARRPVFRGEPFRF